MTTPSEPPPDTERMPAWVPLPDEPVAIFRAVEHYAHGDVDDRVHAMDELAAVIEEIVRRRTEDVYTG